MRQVLPLSVIPAKAGIHCSIAPNFLDFLGFKRRRNGRRLSPG
jgi:hypothetical protein